MSAPVHSLHENSKNLISISNKRKPRRRKFLARSTTITDKSSSPSTSGGNNKIICNRESDNRENFLTEKRKTTTININIGNSNNTNNNNNINSNNRKTINNKVKSTIGCDIVTLVSLISSEGSDSEKEEITNQISSAIDTHTKRAPFLRKTGKSVSFQDDDIPLLKNSTKEPSHILRRGSLAPLAAKLRLNRPPTAPPVPVFITDKENSNLKITDYDNSNINRENKMNSSNNNESPTSSSLAILSSTCTDEKSSLTSTESIIEQQQEYNFPEYVRSSKERECWKLFMKMTMKGVCVTYDTILRGMLTPTELRILQKQQKEFEISKIEK